MKNTKKTILALCTIILTSVILCFSVSAKTYGDYEYNVLQDETVEIISYTGNSKKLKIPSEIKGKTVTQIGRYAFCNSATLESVTVPNSVTLINVGAFDNSEKLKTIILPDKNLKISSVFFNTAYYNNEKNWSGDVLYIGKHLIDIKDSLSGDYKIKVGTLSVCSGAFYGCEGLTGVSIPAGVVEIPSSAFYNCNNLKTITIPDSVTSIADRAFSSCDNLKTITIPNSVTSIGYQTFFGTAHYNKKSNWKNGALYIGKHLIEVDYELSGTFNIKSGTLTIAAGAFDSCDKLTSITIPDSVVSIGSGAFSGCKKIKKLNIPDSVTNIGNNAFGQCNRLERIKIPYGITCIEYAMFEDCNSLKTITIPNSVTMIDGYAFNFCSSLKTVNFIGSKSQWEKIKIGEQNEYLTKAEILFCTHETVKTNMVKATLKKNGKNENTCIDCGDVKKTTVYAPKTIKLSNEKYTYDGKEKTPSVIVKNSKGKTLKKGTDYIVKYAKGRKSVGKYTITVTFKGKYSGTKKLAFEIVPARVTLSKVTAGSKQATLVWKIASGVSGYEVQYSTSKEFKKAKTITVKKGSTNKTTIKKLTKGKKYYVKVRAYKTVNKKTVYGAWSSVKSVKVK